MWPDAALEASRAPGSKQQPGPMRECSIEVETQRLASARVAFLFSLLEIEYRPPLSVAVTASFALCQFVII